MTRREGFPTNFNFHSNERWKPVRIPGPVPVDGWIVGHEDEIISAANGFGYPTPPVGMMLVMLEDETITSVHINRLEDRNE